MADPGPPTSFRWSNGGADLHLIAGNPFELGDVLEVIFENGTTQPWSDLDHRPDGVTVAFTTGAVTFSLGVQGVAVQKDDEFLTGGFEAGHVSSDESPAVRNFIVTATSTGTVQRTLFLRVFLHDELLSARVSPPGLHIPAGNGANFSVLGVFSDTLDGRVAADLTGHPLMSWAVVSNTTDVTVAGSRFNVTDPPANPSQSAQVQVTLPESLYPVGQVPPVTSRQFSATVTPAKKWADWDVVAEPVENTSVQSFKTSRNILFLPDGFTEDDHEKFNTAVKLISRYMHTHPSSRPWDLFLDSQTVNLFKAWLPSSDSGSTVLNELTPVVTNLADRVPVPIAPSGQPPRIANLENLIWQVGLPTKTAGQRSFDQQMTQWVQLFGPFDPSSPPSQKNWSAWKRLFPRYLAVEKDTAFGVAWGTRPQVTDSLSQRDIGFNKSNRTSREQIEPFLARLRLQNQQGQPPDQLIGAQWSTGGKDHALIFFVVNGPNSAGTRWSEQKDAAVFSTLSDSDDVLLKGPVPQDGDILDTDDVPLPTNVDGEVELPPRVRARAVHELSHVIALGDEYAEEGLQLATPAPANLDNGNLHYDKQLQHTPGGPLDGSLIRWGIQWKRLRAGGAMVQLPQITQPGTYLFRLSPGHGAAFKDLEVGAPLRMRLRPLVFAGTFVNLPNESAPFVYQGRTLDQINATGDSGIDDYINQLSALNLTPDRVGLIAPLLDSNSNELGLMHARVAQHITDSNSPLNRLPPTACTLDHEYVQRSPNAPAELIPVPNSKLLKLRYLTRLVGLYDGGARYGCTVYHAQALCMMRSNLRVNFEGVGILLVPVRAGIIAPFCPVCRYLLVDALNPSLHKQIDDDYASQYPKLT